MCFVITAVAGRQLVPGVLVIPDGTRTHPSFHSVAAGAYGVPQDNMMAAAAMNVATSAYSPQTTAAIARELLDTGKVIERTEDNYIQT